jgi:capsular polysaccharide biosynthesis protein
MMLGVVLSVAVLTVLALLDDTIHDEEYVLNTYDYTILGKVPNLLNTGSKSYSYYSQKTPPRAGV